jgi:hypothetical protein
MAEEPIDGHPEVSQSPTREATDALFRGEYPEAAAVRNLVDTFNTIAAADDTLRGRRFDDRLVEAAALLHLTRDFPLPPPVAAAAAAAASSNDFEPDDSDDHSLDPDVLEVADIIANHFLQAAAMAATGTGAGDGGQQGAAQAPSLVPAVGGGATGGNLPTGTYVDVFDNQRIKLIFPASTPQIPPPYATLKAAKQAFGQVFTQADQSRMKSEHTTFLKNKRKQNLTSEEVAQSIIPTVNVASQTALAQGMYIASLLRTPWPSNTTLTFGDLLLHVYVVLFAVRREHHVREELGAKAKLCGEKPNV